MKRIYLDYAATAPLRPEVREAMLPWLGASFGNAGSLHREGRAARAAVDAARDSVARLIQADPREIVFTGSATEANATVLASLQGALALSAVEHPSVREMAKGLRRHSFAVRELPVDGQGRVQHDQTFSGTALVSVMHTNNETGALQPIAELAAAIRAQGALLHCDAVQAAPLQPIDVRALGVDYLSLSAHKLGGPQGVGALFVREGVPLSPLLPGSQEHRRRAGTENVAGIVGFGVACDCILRDLAAEAPRIAALANTLEKGLRDAIPGVRCNAAEASRAPHIRNLAFAGVDNDALVLALDAAGIAVSAGAACTSGISAVSHVLLAMGQTRAQAREAVRFSLGWNTQPDDIARALEIAPRVVARLREASHKEFIP